MSFKFSFKPDDLSEGDIYQTLRFVAQKNCLNLKFNVISSFTLVKSFFIFLL